MDKFLFDNYKSIISYTSPRIQMYLKSVNENIIENIQEIRLRANRPIVIVNNLGSSFLTNTGKLSYILSSNCIIVTKNEIAESINRMCSYSMHSHYEDLVNGYVTLPNGARVGITGTAVFDKEDVKGIKDFDGINIRIPRIVNGASDIILKTLFKNEISNLIIAGQPSSGKTTILKDLMYQLSSGRLGKYYKICVVDERKEIANSKDEANHIGPNTDVLLGFPKAKGISMAVRTLSPDIIICDEISSNEEINLILDSLNSGISFVLSIHANTYDELKRKNSFKTLYYEGGFNNIVLLKSNNEPGVISKIIKQNEVIYEGNNNIIYSNKQHNYCSELCEAN